MQICLVFAGPVTYIPVYLRGYLCYDDFGYTTLDTLALQCNGEKQ